MLRNRAFVSVVMLLALVVLATLCIGVAGFSAAAMRRVKSDRDEAITVQAAQGGLELTVARAFSDLAANKGVLKSKEYNLTDVLGPIATGCTASSTIQPQSDTSYAWVTSTVTYSTFTKSFRTLIHARNVSIWNNAIFAGAGASGQSINGNVDIRGSVHMLGDGEPYTDAAGIGAYFAGDTFTDTNGNGVWDPGEPYADLLGVGHYVGPDPYNDLNGNGVYDPPLTQTSLDDTMSGAAYIGNNYYGIPSSLSSVIPAAPKVNGVETLGTEVRAKHGQISINGSATIGASSPVNAGADKATVDGMYVNDGYTGNQGSAHVYSDNGTTNGYDVGNLGITYPVIYGVGAPVYTDTGGGSWTTQDTYLQTKSLVCPKLTITSTTTAFAYGPDLNGNLITFTPAGSHGIPAALLTITGIVKFAGDLQIGSKDSITFAGNGTLYSTGNINIDGDFTPASGLVFPTTTTVGFISRKNINLATGNGSSQLTLCGAFYAQGKIVSAKQNKIAGTFVGDYYDMGNNVPSIYQVPSLVNNMPPAMPGDKGFYMLKVQTWRER
ncbi:MAG: hypothetical protein HYR64_04465 [Fimbriimonas ginsengisoli]|uniref:Type 4 fimbrial biogenesis protein PilX N-terminal domain-containing protein n=1 Tax=Fimbriimonas ginsengisoli TaxID=1005039 RepID=A0A931PTG6_FIMGI|nr:hypothetical protein [Fimbriimonas ginsengisoli]